MEESHLGIKAYNKKTRYLSMIVQYVKCPEEVEFPFVPKAYYKDKIYVIIKDKK